MIKLGAGTCIPHYLLHCKYISSLILHCPNCSFSLCANSHLLPVFFWHSIRYTSLVEVLCISLTKIQFFRCVPIPTVYICSVHIARDILDKLEYKLGYGAESKKKTI